VVAVKVLHHSDPYLRDKFRKEGQEIARLLRHPHVVRVYGGGQSRGVLYLVMEFMDGGTLRERLSPNHPLPADQIVSIAGHVCDALQYAHRAGIYHRDIKPENIFFSSNGQVKLGDFGIARIAQSVTRTASGWLIGTPHYMSYEQAKGHPIDGRSDLYSLGVVLYEMATGRCPFTAGNPLMVVDKHIKERPVPPSRFNRELPSNIEDVILRALEKNRQQRFRSADQMARALGYSRPMHGGEQARPRSRAKRQASAAHGSLQLVHQDGTAIRLGKDGTHLNRGDVSPGDREMSRQHARVVRRRGNYWIEDMGSSNGTYLNGLRIFSPQVLKPGDEIRLGRTVLHVERRQ
jgi:serine/threonine protein kinase